MKRKPSELAPLRNAGWLRIAGYLPLPSKTKSGNVASGNILGVSRRPVRHFGAQNCRLPDNQRIGAGAPLRNTWYWPNLHRRPLGRLCNVLEL